MFLKVRLPRKRAALFRRRRVLIPPFTLVILLDAGEDVGTLLNWSIPGSSILPHDLGGETALRYLRRDKNR